MTQIPITKKEKFTPQEIAKGMEQSPQAEQANEEQKQPSRKWLFLGIALALIIIISVLNYWFFVSHKQAFADLIPENATATAIINQTDFYPQVSNFSQVLTAGNFFGQTAINRIGQYFSQAGLSFSGDFLPLFKTELGLAVLPANSGTSLPFLVIFERKQGLAKVSQVLTQIKPELNKDFNVSVQDYRQIEVLSLSPLASGFSRYFYALIEEYLIISNSQESLQEIIDSVIDN